MREERLPHSNRAAAFEQWSQGGGRSDATWEITRSEAAFVFGELRGKIKRLEEQLEAVRENLHQQTLAHDRETFAMRRALEHALYEDIHWKDEVRKVIEGWINVDEDSIPTKTPQGSAGPSESEVRGWTPAPADTVEPHSVLDAIRCRNWGCDHRPAEEEWQNLVEQLEAAQRKVDAYDRARSRVKIEGNTRAEYVLRIESVEEQLDAMRKHVEIAIEEMEQGAFVNATAHLHIALHSGAGTSSAEGTNEANAAGPRASTPTKEPS